MSSYRDQVIPIVATLFGSLLTVEFLYSYVTYNRGVLVVSFLLLYGILKNAKQYVVHTLYPDRKDGKIEPRRASITGFCGLGMNISAIIITRLVFDIFMMIRGKIHMKWWQYIDLFTMGITFLSSFLVNK